ncbi:TetR family transcriptional regulator [Agrococcus sp. SGAir0287]|uniref:TetR family transcriptional regulator n=1 Tax=Agrococcus sp. SGAir0287 TaxID=2070347 RepID=UPI0010CCE2F2|nr:TetR family transcriptional regulator [Agrococcus sp. SGAir0287]QCR19703.1 TetR family transcriptional regulator [Agrococcus sp. SGAir0287]
MSQSEVPVRDRARVAVREQIARVAVDLFVRDGFDEVSIDRIAAASGISRRTFFRYFATKEDAAIGDVVERGRVVAAAIAARPQSEGAWDAVLAVASESVAAWDDPAQELAIGRLMLEVPSLRARHLEKQLAWRALIEPTLATRLRDGSGLAEGDAVFEAAAIASTALACLDVASEAWVRSGGAGDLGEGFARALAAVRR